MGDLTVCCCSLLRRLDAGKTLEAAADLLFMFWTEIDFWIFRGSGKWPFVRECDIGFGFWSRGWGFERSENAKMSIENWRINGNGWVGDL